MEKVVATDSSVPSWDGVSWYAMGSKPSVRKFLAPNFLPKLSGPARHGTARSSEAPAEALLIAPCEEEAYQHSFGDEPILFLPEGRRRCGRGQSQEEG